MLRFTYFYAAHGCVSYTPLGMIHIRDAAMFSVQILQYCQMVFTHKKNYQQKFVPKDDPREYIWLTNSEQNTDTVESFHEKYIQTDRQTDRETIIIFFADLSK